MEFYCRFPVKSAAVYVIYRRSIGLKRTRPYASILRAAGTTGTRIKSRPSKTSTLIAPINPAFVRRGNGENFKTHSQCYSVLQCTESTWAGDLCAMWIMRDIEFKPEQSDDLPSPRALHDNLGHRYTRNPLSRYLINSRCITNTNSRLLRRSAARSYDVASTAAIRRWLFVHRRKSL